jgi:hypothetical protein
VADAWPKLSNKINALKVSPWRDCEDGEQMKGFTSCKTCDDTASCASELGLTKQLQKNWRLLTH